MLGNIPNEQKRAGLKCKTRPTNLTNLESDDSLEHDSIEFATMADVIHRIAREFLRHVFELRHDHRREEHARAELPALRANVSRNPGQASFDFVVPCRHEELIAGAGTMDDVDCVLSELAIFRLRIRA